jgi:hypothetical protein
MAEKQRLWLMLGAALLGSVMDATAQDGYPDWTVRLGVGVRVRVGPS